MKLKKLKLILLSLCTLTVSASEFDSLIKPTFEKSCNSCHGAKGKIKGKINLFEIENANQLMQKPELLEEVIIAIEDGDMPPEDEPQLEKSQKEELLKTLKSYLNKSISSLNSLPHTEIRRMNRFQYNNAVTDLLELKVELFPLPEKMMRDYGYFDPSSEKMPNEVKVGSRPLGKSQMISKRMDGVLPFPQDLRAEHGFDNRADHLTLSPILMESFLNLSNSIVNSADFTGGKIGIWNSFFKEPKGGITKDILETRLKKFLTKAFRRTIQKSTLNRYKSYVLKQINNGETYLSAMKAVVSAVIASPKFLYIYDYASTDNAEKLDNFELASKMSFFLWGSIPDDELLVLAESGKLHKEKYYQQQISRMLKDPKLKRFCDSFAPQWMQLERIISSTPDRKKYADFYFSKFRHSIQMMLEPLLLFETVLIENKSILNFIDADFTYQADIMKDWHLGKKPKGKVSPSINVFKRIKLTDRRQGGLITSPAMLTMTSGVFRTHPITRGEWILSTIFNDPPLPAPADVPPLPEKAAIDDSLTLREKFEKHRSSAECKSCHAKIDPLGFALENFDAIGRWRTKYENGREVDSSGTLYKKHKFTNIIEFKDALLKEKDRYVLGLSKHLLSFALGRKVSPADKPSLEFIFDKTLTSQYRFKDMIHAVMNSQSFLNKYNPKEVANVK